MRDKHRSNHGLRSPKTLQTWLFRINKNGSDWCSHAVQSKGRWRSSRGTLLSAAATLQGGPGVNRCEGSYQQGGSENNCRDVPFDYPKDSKETKGMPCFLLMRSIGEIHPTANK